MDTRPSKEKITILTLARFCQSSLPHFSNSRSTGLFTSNNGFDAIGIAEQCF